MTMEKIQINSGLYQSMVQGSKRVVIPFNIRAREGEVLIQDISTKEGAAGTITCVTRYGYKTLMKHYADKLMITDKVKFHKALLLMNPKLGESTIVTMLVFDYFRELKDPSS